MSPNIHNNNQGKSKLNFYLIDDQSKNSVMIYVKFFSRKTNNSIENTRTDTSKKKKKAKIFVPKLS